MYCICPETAFSATPDSNHLMFSSLHAVFIANLASKLSTQLSNRSTGLPFKLPVLKHDCANVDFVSYLKHLRYDVHKMIKIIYGSNIVIVSDNLDIWIDIL